MFLHDWMPLLSVVETKLQSRDFALYFATTVLVAVGLGR